MLNVVDAGGHDRQNTTPASAAAAAAVVFSVNYLSPPAGRGKPRTAIRIGQGRDWPGYVGAVQTRPCPPYLAPPIQLITGVYLDYFVLL